MLALCFKSDSIWSILTVNRLLIVQWGWALSLLLA